MAAKFAATDGKGHIASPESPEVRSNMGGFSDFRVLAQGVFAAQS